MGNAELSRVSRDERTHFPILPFFFRDRRLRRESPFSATATIRSSGLLPDWRLARNRSSPPYSRIGRFPSSCQDQKIPEPRQGRFCWSAADQCSATGDFCTVDPILWTKISQSSTL